MAPPLFLLTDFGTQDPYVAQLRLVLAAQAPAAPVIDLSHELTPFALSPAAYFLAVTAPYLPQPSVTLAVVDPGVGTARRIVCLQLGGVGGRLLLGPDNGLFGLLLREAARERMRIAGYDLTEAEAPLPGPALSATFHGRDRFAPLAARLARGVPPGELGPPLNPAGLVPLPIAEPLWDGAALTAEILSRDRYGNLLLHARSDIYYEPLAALAPLVVEAGGQALPLAPARTYDDSACAELLLLPGSQGYLELALRQRSAAAYLRLGPGDSVLLRGVSQS